MLDHTELKAETLSQMHEHHHFYKDIPNIKETHRATIEPRCMTSTYNFHQCPNDSNHYLQIIVYVDRLWLRRHSSAPFCYSEKEKHIHCLVLDLTEGSLFMIPNDYPERA